MSALIFSQIHLLDLVDDFQELEVRRVLYGSGLVNPTLRRPNFEPKNIILYHCVTLKTLQTWF